ncbi:MAG: hypothetical protein K9I94_07190 [Bacteroidales bacterium]|nr:hypothetical protein [Bacteroidales bacterium]
MYRLVKISIFILALLLLKAISVRGQLIPENISDTASNNILFQKAISGGVFLHTTGWGLQFRKWDNITFFKQRMLELEFEEIKSAKEKKTINPYFANAKRYVFGKLNNFYVLRAGYGIQNLLNEKPYWGGVSVSYFYYGGLAAGIVKPVYIYMIEYDIISTYYLEYSLVSERYDPDKHFADNIYGKAPFTDGIENIKFRPGLYGKFGFSFEFGDRNQSIKTLDVGASLEFYPKGIQLMAFNPTQNFFLNGYVAFSFGKRYNSE